MPRVRSSVGGHAKQELALECDPVRLKVARLRTSTFDYDLPDSQIARRPTEARDGARMLVVQRDEFLDDWVRNFCERVPERALLVLNDTRVRRARVLGKRRESGGKVELLLLERVDTEPRDSNGSERWLALGKPMRALRADTVIEAPGLEIRVVGRATNDRIELEISAKECSSVETVLERYGHVPIPPYLGRSDDESDAVRYQTVYAQRSGSVAAPTAGLHLTDAALQVLRQRGVEIGTVTLHVGIGTFRPVAVDDLDQHDMHSEWFEVNSGLVAMVADARRRGAPVIAVGTTAVRALESAADPNLPGAVRSVASETRLLIQPGYQFRVVNGLLTNFHQPRSTLIALVAAAIGVERVQSAYREAIMRGYRFLSYGDAMWIPELIG